MKQHPLGKIIPDMDETDFANLLESVKERGPNHAIVIFEGKVLDHWHLYNALLKAGFKPQRGPMPKPPARARGIHFTKFEGTRDEARDFVWDENMARRHLNLAQRMDLALTRKKELAAAARLRQSTKEPGGSSVDEQLAEIAGASPTSIRQWERVKENAAPAIIDAALRGDVKVSDAMAVSELPAARQERALKKVQDGKATTLRQAAGVKKERPKPQKPAPESVKDKIGNEVPKHLRDKIGDMAMADVVAGLTEAVVALKACARWNPWLALKDTAAAVEEVRDRVRESLPYAVCPSCGGERDGCRDCRASGFVTQVKFKELKADEKALAKA